MDTSPFDFDVVTGPALPRDRDKPKSPQDGGEKPDTEAEEAHPRASAAAPARVTG